MTGGRRGTARASLSFSFAALILLSYIPLKIAQHDSPSTQLAIFLLSSVLIYVGAAILFRDSENGRIMTAAISVIFVLYLAILVNFTVFDGNFGRERADGAALETYADYFGKRVNLIPFKMIYRQTKGLISGTYRPVFYITNIAGNLAAFAPTAFFLPALFKKCRKFGFFFLTVSALIVAIEALQFFLKVGSMDIDDYILNIIGASAAFALLSTASGKRLTSYTLRPSRRTGDGGKNNKGNRSLI
ncbi:MAG: VanZ family protein [Clostridia bacterium]|nr:VanZ family protein [Clostridia bacterium]